MEKRKLGMAALGHFFCDVNTGSLPAVIPFLVSSYGFSYSAVTGLMFANSSLASVVQPAFGLLADRTQGRWLMPAGLFLAGCGMASVGIASHYWTLFFAIMLSGIGSALFHPVAMRFVNACAGDRKSTATSLFTVGGNAGFLLAPLLIAALIQMLGLAGAIFLAVPSSIMAVALWRQQTGSASAAGEKKQSSQSSNNWRSFARLMIVVATQSLLLLGIRTLAPLYLMERFGLSSAAASMSLTLFGIGSIASNIAGGMLGDRFGCRKVIRTGYTMLVPMTLALPFIGNLSVAFALIFTINVLLFLPFSSVVVMGQRYLAKNVGFASGATMGLGVSLGGMFAPALGYIADSAGLIAALQVMGACTFAGMFAAWLLPSAGMERKSS